MGGNLEHVASYKTITQTFLFQPRRKGGRTTHPVEVPRRGRSLLARLRRGLIAPSSSISEDVNPHADSDGLSVRDHATFGGLTGGDP
jgi:hypothetical protein